MKKWFNNLNIRKKLLLSFSVVIILLGFVGIIGLKYMNEIKEQNEILYNQVTLPVEEIGTIRYIFQDIRISVRDMVFADNAAAIDSITNSINAASAIVGKIIPSLESTLITEEEQKVLAEFRIVRKEYQKYRKEAMALAEADKDKEAIYLLQATSIPATLAYADVSGKLFKMKTQYGQVIQGNIERLEKNANYMMIAAIILGIALGVILALYISNLISDGVNQISHRIKSLSEICITNVAKASDMLAKGDLDISIDTGTQPLNIESKDEIGVLARNINTIIFDIQGAAKSLDAAVSEIKRTIGETSALVTAAYEGRLDVRSDGSSFSGGYKQLVEGLNKTLDAVATPFNESNVVLGKMSKGDLTVRMAGDYHGDYKILKDSINQLGISMNEALSEVLLAVQSTASASAQISSSSEEMAAGSQEQSHQTTEVAGAIEEMTRTIIEGSKNTGIAAENSKTASENARKGTLKVQETKEGIQKIVESTNETGAKISSLTLKTDQIGEITQVIDDIADQTNLLALNAAIEAARAGEQGRGFAVVADEVRKLAERTMTATKEIGSTIKSIQTEAKEANISMETAGKAVDHGMRLAEEVADVLNEILSSANIVSDIIAQVAAAGEQQSAASEQISRNVEGISSVTQQSAQGIDQIAHAAEDLNRLTLNLQNLVNKFEINSGSDKPVRPASKTSKDKAA